MVCGLKWDPIHPGEIKPLEQAAGVNIAVITSIEYSHIEHFKIFTGHIVRREFDCEKVTGKGLLVVNGDDSNLSKPHPLAL